MLNKALIEITMEDLKQLIEDGIPEGKTLEYKRDLSISADADKKEFLADISSFANVEGGDLIFGIEEDRETGLPSHIVGIEISNVDVDIRRIEGLIREGISPRLPRFDIHEIEIEKNKYVLVVRIYKSFVSPHRVVIKGWDKFFSRTTKGKYPLDVNELRIAFNLSSTYEEKIKSFVQERISRLYLNETPINYNGKAKLILHIIPLNSFNTNSYYDVSIIKDNITKLGISPIYTSGWSYRVNFDGYLLFSSDTSGKSYSYAQFYKNGIIEFVNSSTLESSLRPNEHIIPSVLFEKEVISKVEQCYNYFKNMNNISSIMIYISLLGVKDYTMAVDSYKFPFIDRDNIDRDILMCTPVYLEDFEVKTEQVLQKAFDSIWNACGISRSLCYDKDGNWIYR